MKQEFSLSGYWRVIRRRWPLVIALPVLAIIFSAVYYAFLFPPMPYEAKAIVQVGKKIGDQNGQGLYYLGQANQQLLLTYQNIAKSRSVIEKVAAALPDQPNPDELLQKVTVSTIKGTELLQISMRDQDPKRAAELANLTVTAFAQRLTEIENAEVLQVVDYAVEPKTRVYVNKINNIVLVGLLSLLASTLLAFLLEFAGKTKANK
ncbi:MAG: YveK family protein [Desulfosporosinus sp.]|jgi:capsular polysaccharide biosynthesis protein